MESPAKYREPHGRFNPRYTASTFKVAWTAGSTGIGGWRLDFVAAYDRDFSVFNR